MIALQFATPETPILLDAIAECRDERGAISHHMVTLEVGDDFMKADVPKLGYGEVAPGGERWVTVHPWGKAEQGVPVLLRPSKTHKGTYDVIGGAGGKLNYLKVSGVKSPEEYAKQGAEKRTQKNAELKEKYAAEDAKRKGMTPEDRTADDERKKAVKASQEEVKAKVAAERRKLVEGVAGTQGWKDDDWKFDKQAERLLKGGASEKRIQQLEGAHYRAMYSKAKEALRKGTHQLVLDRSARGGADIHALPLDTEDEEKVGLRDMLPDESTPSGPGYKSPTKESSDREIAEHLSTIDTAVLKKRLAKEERDLEHGDGDPVATAEVEETRAELHAAELVKKSLKLTPEEIEKQAKAAGKEKDALAAEQAKLGAKVTALREQGGPKLEAAEAAFRVTTEKLTEANGKQADVAIMAGEMSATLGAEEKGLKAERMRARMEQVAAEGRDPEAYAAAVEHFRAMSERYRAEIKNFRDKGILRKPEVETKPILDTTQLLKLLAQKKGVDKLERALHGAKVREESIMIDEILGKGFYTEAGEVSAAEIAAAETKIKGEIASQLTRSFLEKAESPALLGEEEFGEGDEKRLYRALNRHISMGAFDSLNKVALSQLKVGALSREAVDTLGATGAAQLLAWRISQGSTPKELKEMAKGLGEYHATKSLEQSEATMVEAEADLAAGEDAIKNLSSGEDLAVIAAAQKLRSEKIEAARAITGRALGEFEAEAALVQALGQGPVDKLDVTLGAIPAETAIRQMRALGLQRQDYDFSSDGKNTFVSIKKEAFDKLITKPDPVRAKLQDEVTAIKRGEQDDPNWRPLGTTIRPPETFDAAKMDEDYFKKLGVPADKIPINTQSVKVHEPAAQEAIARALAPDPRRMVAFTPLGELTHQDEKAIRSYYESTAAQRGASWTGKDGKSTWRQYVSHMGGRQKAFQAIQDRLKSEFIADFHRSYTAGRTPLSLGVQSIEHGHDHGGFGDQAGHEKLLAGHQKGLQAARGGLKKPKVGQAETVARQAAMKLVGGTRAATSRGALAEHERYTLGARAEAELVAVMPDVARNFVPGKPVSLMPDKQWAGKYIAQQRGIKAFVKSKRMFQALGVGSGKTAIQIGAFSQLKAEGKAKRALYLTPSGVQGQFGEEFTKYIEPGTMNWAANPGGDHAQRMKEDQDPKTDAVVHTHEGFREDMMKLLAEHYGGDEKKAATEFMALDRKGASAVMKEVWKKAGISFDMINVDEGHKLLDREGKPDSVLSRIVEAASDNTPYAMMSSADPIKNDISEMRSVLDKLAPDGRYSDEKDWKRRYGVNTSASAEALQREVAPYLYSASVTGGHKVNRRTVQEGNPETVPLSPEQKKRYSAVMTAFDDLGAARGRGEVDIAAAKVLSPERFEGQPVAKHEAIARVIQRNPGTLRENALNRVVNLEPRATNPKIQWIAKKLKSRPISEHPAIIFARNLKAVDEINESLAEAGLRTEKFTGADSGPERDEKRKAFQGDGKTAPKVDVIVASDAAQAGLNLQRGQQVIQYDRPLTSMGHQQRFGRADRVGQKNKEIDTTDIVTDSPYEERAGQRIRDKHEIRSIFTDPSDKIDDTGVAQVFSEARKRAAGGRMAA